MERDRHRPPPRSLAAVLFDLDGTLVDTMPAFADLAAEVMAARHGVDRILARARYLETSGLPFVDQLEIICPGHAANRAASDEFERRKLAVCDAMPMDARTVAGLEALRALGLRLIVSSNTGQAVVDEFARREAFRFDLVLGFDPARGLRKGRPHVDHALAVLGIARDQLVLVGDSLKDGDLADESGVAFIGRIGTFGEDDFRRRDPRAVTVRAIDELPAALGARLATAPG
ncbi:MAG TPA: HAD family hydrolase [Kofleriaceae bacterium]|nr:HAD family hydrolase [Kofleriaceae bacterium]